MRSVATLLDYFCVIYEPCDKLFQLIRFRLVVRVKSMIIVQNFNFYTTLIPFQVRCRVLGLHTCTYSRSLHPIHYAMNFLQDR